MAHAKYANAMVMQPQVSGRGWGRVRKTAAAPTRNIMAQAAEILGGPLDPDRYLLTHSTIVASVDVDEVPNVKLGKVKVGKRGFERTINRKYSDYHIDPRCSRFVNNNGDSWSRQVLLASYQTFIGGHNFCFAPGTGILLANGTYKPIEDIEVGDRVVTHTGSVQPVTHKFERNYEGDIHAVRFDRFKDPILVTGNHPFRGIEVSANPIRPRKGTRRANTLRYWKDQVTKALRGDPSSLQGFKAGKAWVRADHMTPGSYVLGPERQVGNINTPALAELLGYYLAEGCPLSPTTDQGFVLSFGHHERDLAERAKRLAYEAINPTSVTMVPVQTGIQVRVYSAAASRRMVALGGHLAHQKRISEEVLGWNRESLLRLLAAWMAGDGNLHKGTLRLRGSTASKALAEQMQRVAELCGIKSSVVFERQKVGEVQSRVVLTVGGEPRTFDVIPRHHSWTVLVSKGSTAQIATRSPRWGVPLHDASKSRKRSEFAWWGNCRVHRVASNDTLPYAGKVYNIEVKGDHSYVVDNGIAVHNCEHVQIEEQSKGRIIDAVARDIGESVYVDILVATDRRHNQLIGDIKSGKMTTLSMGCFIAGTMVTMADGTRVPIEDVQPGDMVLTHKGRAREVLNKQIRGGAWGMRTIHAVGLSSPITSTDNHPFYVLRPADTCACGCGEGLPAYAPPKGGLKHKYTTRRMTRRFKKGHDKRILNPNGSYSLEEYRERQARMDDIQRPKLLKVRADELRVGDFIAFPRVQDGEQTVEVSEARARLLGYFLAEGSFNKRKGRRTTVVFSFSMEEKETYVAEVCRLLEQEFPGKNKPWVQDRPERNTCVAYLTSRKAADWFYKHGGEYSHGKRLSVEAMNWSADNHRHMIGTWLNGDGTCAKAHNGFLSGTTVSYDLANQMHALMAKCGWFARYEARIGSRSATVAEAVNGGIAVRDEVTGRLPAYTLVLSNTQSVQLQEYSDKAPTTAHYENQNFRTLDDWTVAPITEIEAGEHNGWVHDMEVEEDHTYVVEGAIVSNCSVEETICTKCGNVAVDETDLCPCIKYEKLNKFIDEAGQQRVIAELCFPPGTRVTLSDGRRVAIDDIQVGDAVLSHTGNRREVVETFERNYVGDLVALNLVGVPQTLRSTPNHPYWVISQNDTCACGCGTPLKSVRKTFGRGEYLRKYAPGHNPTNVVSLEPPAFDFKEAGDLQVGDMVAMPAPDGVIVPEDVDETRARLLGWFLAEGSYLKKNGERIGIQITLNADDEVEIADTLSSLLSEAFPPEVNRKREFRLGALDILSDAPTTARQVAEAMGAKLSTVLAALKGLRDLGLAGSRRVTADEKADFGALNTNTLLWSKVGEPDLREWGCHPRVHLYDRTTEEGQKLTVCYVNQAAAEWFFEHAGEYAGEKRLSPNAIFWPKALQATMLQAYLRGDGTVDGQMRHMVSSVSETLISQMQVVAARCGFWTRRQVVFEGRCVELAAVVNGSAVPVGSDGFRPRHELHIQPSDEATAFFGIAGGGDGRGLAPAWRSHEGYMLYRVRDVWSEPYTGRVHNIAVNRDHSYLVEGVAVHNCGHPDIEDNAGVHFIEASWVATPAFPGAVLRNILDLERASPQTIRQIQAALAQPPTEWDGSGARKVASIHAFDFGTEDEDQAEAESEAPEPKNPLDEAAEEIEGTIRERAVKKIKKELEEEDVEKALGPSDAPNDSVIKEGYRMAVKALTKKASSNVEFVDGLASVNRAFGVKVDRDIYRASLRVGSTTSYPSMGRFLRACHHAVGRPVLPAEIRVMVRIGNLLSRLGGNPTRKESSDV